MAAPAVDAGAHVTTAALLTGSGSSYAFYLA